MGVNYRPALYLGKEFDGESEVIDFIQKYYHLHEGLIAEINEDGLGEWLYNLKVINRYHSLSKIDITQLNHYVGDEESGFLLGINILAAVQDPDNYKDSIESATDTWNSVFPNSECSIIAEVKIS